MIRLLVIGAVLAFCMTIVGCGDDDCEDDAPPAMVTVVVTFEPTTTTPGPLITIRPPTNTPGTPPVLCFGATPGTPCPTGTPTSTPADG